MDIKGKGLIKMALIIFIGVAVYSGHRSFFDNIPGKIKDAVPEFEKTEEKTEEKKANQSKKLIKSYNEKDPAELDFEFSSKEDSLVGDLVSGVLNKVLENPKGRLIVKDTFQKILRQAKEIAGRDVLLSRYLVNDISIGDGEDAMCGDTVEILYSIVSKEDKKKQELKTTIELGKGTIGKNLETGIIGMKKGGKRTIVYPETLIPSHKPPKPKKDKSNIMSATAELLSIKNKRTDNKKLGRSFFDKIDEKHSTGMKLICGDKVKGSYFLSDLKGNILYDSKKAGKNFSFRIGEEKVPLELSKALLGLPASKARVSFITSPATITNVFGGFKDFVPKSVFVKKETKPVILNFDLALIIKP